MRNDEIERKFLVVGGDWRESTPGEQCRQGYVVFGPPVSVRVRLMGGRGFLTLKRVAGDLDAAQGPIERLEFEYELPPDEAAGMLESLCEATLEKIRYRRDYGGHLWEIDEFSGANAGLIVAEIELKTVDAAFDKPPWVGVEISHDPRYLNANLARRPYRDWATS